MIQGSRGTAAVVMMGVMDTEEQAFSIEKQSLFQARVSIRVLLNGLVSAVGSPSVKNSKQTIQHVQVSMTLQRHSS